MLQAIRLADKCHNVFTLLLYIHHIRSLACDPQICHSTTHQISDFNQIEIYICFESKKTKYLIEIIEKIQEKNIVNYCKGTVGKVHKKWNVDSVTKVNKPHNCI